MEWLRSLPHGPIQIEQLTGVQFVHGSPVDEDEYVVSLRDALEPLMASSVALTFFGHTHLQGAFLAQDVNADAFRPNFKTVGQSESCEFPIKPGLRYLVNPGSVGQPRDGDWRAGFVMYESDDQVVTFYRVPYNLKRAQEKILAAKLPQRLATRLAAGR